MKKRVKLEGPRPVAALTELQLRDVIGGDGGEVMALKTIAQNLRG